MGGLAPVGRHIWATAIAYMSLTTYMSPIARPSLAPDPARIAPGYTLDEHGSARQLVLGRK
jgi:hypothetical protein